MAVLQDYIDTEERNGEEKEEHDFTVKTWKEDLCLIVEGKRFYVASNILALISPVFESIIQENVKKDGNTEIILSGKRSADVIEFLKCIYPGIMKEVTIENALQLISLANEYQVTTLKSKCEACFLKSVNKKASTEKIYKTLNIACFYSMSDLLEKCTNLACERSLADLDKANEKISLPLKVTCEIQKKVIAKMTSEQQKADQKLNKLLHDQQTLKVLYQYHRTGVPKKERLELADFLDWEGKSAFIKVDLRRCNLFFQSTVHTCYMDICKTLLKLEFEISNNITLAVSITDTAVHKTIKLVGKVVVLNGIDGKEDICQKIEAVLNYRAKSEQTIMIHQGYQDIRSWRLLYDEGYIYNGELSVEVHILASNSALHQFSLLSLMG